MTSPMLIDTHAHINFSEYENDREEVMRRAFQTGVKKILHSCCRVHEIETLINLSKEFNGTAEDEKFVYASFYVKGHLLNAIHLS